MKKYPLESGAPASPRSGGLSASQLKTLRALKLKKGRRAQKRFLIEGVHLCAEALGSDHLPVLLLYTAAGFQSPEIKETVIQAQRHGVANLRVSGSILASLADAATPQGIMAVMEMRTPEAIPGAGQIHILMDQVRDPGNAGTIIRTADAVGAAGVYLAAGSVDLYNPKVLRSTQGSIFHLPVAAEIDPAVCLKTLRNKGFRVFIADPRADRSHTEVRYPGRFVLAVGNETHGVSQEVRDRADQLIRVPIRGRAESLNVAMACGVILYEALRQRMKRKPPGTGRKRRRRP
jgi:TrmH family RNA methyltransferase